MLLKWKKRKPVCVCSWCRTVIAINNYQVSDGADAASHGLCESCMSRLEARSLTPPGNASQLRRHAS
jgi:hypothetical protein